MDNTALAYAQFISVTIGIVLILGRGGYNYFKHRDKEVLAADEVKKAVATMKDLVKTVEGTNLIVKSIDEHGSKGANKEFEKLRKTLRNHSGRLYRIEGKVNGGLADVPIPNEDEIDG